VKLLVRAPATAANLGPGFDCMGVAFDLANEFELDTSAPPGVTVEGEGADELPQTNANLVVRTMTYVAGMLTGGLPAFGLHCRNAIPLQHGLGSSASAVVAGVLLADRLLDAELTPDRLLEIAVDSEGHADNVAACLRGGLILAHHGDDGWRAERLQPHADLRPVLLIPLHERVSTKDARRVLPRTIPIGDAAFTASRAALAVVALTRNPSLLATALEDRLHQPYRLPLMPSARALFHDLKDDGIPVCVAGSGPTLLAFEQDGRTVQDLGPGWRVMRPAFDLKGATVREAGTAADGEQPQRQGAQ